MRWPLSSATRALPRLRLSRPIRPSMIAAAGAKPARIQAFCSSAAAVVNSRSAAVAVPSGPALRRCFHAAGGVHGHADSSGNSVAGDEGRASRGRDGEPLLGRKSLPARDDVHARSLADPEGFWREAAEQVVWDRFPDTILDRSADPIHRWFVGGKLNTAYNALDVHVDVHGRGTQVALYYDSPVAGIRQSFTYAELRDLVARFAGALARLGVGHGDRVLVYFPNIPQAAIAMLACARLGAIHSTVFGGFSAKELAARIDDARPAVIVAASCGLEPARRVDYMPLLDEALRLTRDAELAARVKCIIYQRPGLEPAPLTDGRDLSWERAVEGAEPHPCVPVDATHPLYILYTSGTTGQPKGVVRENGGHLVALKHSMTMIYDCHPGEVFWAASDVGWVVGHSYGIYAPLFAGCTSVMYEGKPVLTPDAGAFWRVIQDYGVTQFFTAPTAFRAVARVDPDADLLKKYDVSSLRTLFLAGERSDDAILHWAADKLRVPVVDHYWQTETGWSISAYCRGLRDRTRRSEMAREHETHVSRLIWPQRAVPGWDVRILDDDGKPVVDDKALAGGHTLGNLVCKLPLPPGATTSLWGRDGDFQELYLSRFPGYYFTGDCGWTGGGSGEVSVMSRLDDVINVAGHRLSTGVMEEAIANHEGVAECAVVGAAHPVKGQVPVALVVLKATYKCEEPRVLEQELAALVRSQVGPVAAFRASAIVMRLPKTRSGKILRNVMRAMADGRPFVPPATIDDPAILLEIREQIQELARRSSGD